MHSAHIGFVGNGRVSGWFDFTEFQALDRVIAELFIDDVRTGDAVCAKTSVHADWSCLIPRAFGDGKAHEVRVRFRARDRILNEITWSGILSDHPYNFHIDEVTPKVIRGWVKESGLSRKTMIVELRIGDEPVSRTTANRHRGEVRAAGYHEGNFGFELHVPLEARFTGAIASLGVLQEDGTFFTLDAVHLVQGPVKVMFVTDASDPANASRYYRAQLQGRQLWQAGAEVAVKHRAEVTGNMITTFDVVVLQRVPMNPALRAAVKLARDGGAVILYETDDLNVFAELADQIGAVRSGFRRIYDEEFLKEIRDRYASLTCSDAVIVPNRFMERYFQQRGFEVIFSQFVVDAKLPKAIADRSSVGWKMLYLSGSPTHRADLDTVIDDLHAFMSDHPDAELTVLGHSDPSAFHGWERTSFHPAVSYTDMIQFIGGFDIVIVPFEKTVFNYAKSATKVLEAACVGVPVIASAVPDYVQAVKDAHAGYVVPWGTNWRTVLGQAYANREADRASFHRLVQFAELRSSGLRGGSELLTAFCTLYRNVICLPPTYRATGTNRDTAVAARA